jgi:hypothetical protein
MPCRETTGRIKSRVDGESGVEGLRTEENRRIALTWKATKGSPALQAIERKFIKVSWAS